MTDNTTQDPWDNFWTGTRRTGTTAGSGAQDPALPQFWTGWFQARLDAVSNTDILDLACGDGAVTGYALAAGEGRIGPDQVICLDSSAAAIENVIEAYPGVRGISADAAATGLPAARFGCVVSQFGVEYAGIEALDEAARVLAPGGELALVMHFRGGAIHAECETDRQALADVLGSGVLAAFVRLFEENQALRRGRGSEEAFEAADRALNPCVKRVEAALTRHGKEVANGVLFRLYADIAHMYQRMNNHEPAEAIAWAKRAEVALEAFSRRMQSMEAAALDAEAAGRARDRLAAAGLVELSLESLALGDPPEAGAWVLTGRKQNP